MYRIYPATYFEDDMDNVYFEDIYNLYKFDVELKTIVFEAATNIEINFKSLLSEVISSQYGEKDSKYLKKENFAPDIIHCENIP